MLEKSINKGYRDGLERAIEIIEKELEFAKLVNPQMAIGMSQIKMLIHQEINK